MDEKEMLDMLQVTLDKVNSAISDIGYADSYSYGRASNNYCSYAKSSLYEARNNLTTMINALSPESVEEEENTEDNESTM